MRLHHTKAADRARKGPGHRPARWGGAVVEFAVVVPLLLMFILGTIEVGRFMMVQEIVVNAAREGARRGVIIGATDNDVQTIIDNYLSSSTISGHTRSVTPGLATAKSGDLITVRVSVPYQNISWLPAGATRWLNSRNAVGTVVMRKE
jgi:Flp pilus assembly protein TadG